jgi:nucleotide-binding universal stress UspA family protein
MKKSVKNILCPTDFSDAANNAMEYAATLAKQFNASLTLWIMFELPMLDGTATKSELPHRIRRKQDELQEVLNDWCNEIKKEFNIPCNYTLEHNISSLEKTLTHYTDKENYDLIVAGTNGADDLYQYYFGTNSYRIIEQMKYPVLIVPENCTYQDISSIIFTTDYSHNDMKTLKVLLNTFKAKVTILHISQHDTKVSKEVFHSFQNRLDEQFNFDNRIRFHREIGSNTLEGINTFLQKNATDLIVLSAKHQNLLEKLLHKSFTRELLDSIGIPVLVFNNLDS